MRKAGWCYGTFSEAKFILYSSDDAGSKEGDAFPEARAFFTERTEGALVAPAHPPVREGRYSVTASSSSGRRMGWPYESCRKERSKKCEGRRKGKQTYVHGSEGYEVYRVRPQAGHHWAADKRPQVKKGPGGKECVQP